MGLERVAAVLQGKVSNFETDLFVAIDPQSISTRRPADSRGLDPIKMTHGTPRPLEPREIDDIYISLLAPNFVQDWMDKNEASLRVIADHARAATFLISDGVVPSNEGRGYVLRKILRRAIRHGRLLGQEKPFLFEMVFAVRDLMQGAYPELVDSAERVAKVVEAEEKQFDRVLAKGSYEWDNIIVRQLNEIYRKQWKFREDLKGIVSPEVKAKLELSFSTAAMLIPASEPPIDVEDAIGKGVPASMQKPLLEEWKKLHEAKPSISGEDAFHLYETFGLPLDFMVDAARDAGIAFDHLGFEKARAEEQARARASWKGGSQKTASPAYRDLPKTVFEGYRQLTSTNCEVLAIVKGGIGVPAAKAGEEVEVVLDHTSFYGDSGGQVGDLGWFTSTDGNSTVAEIVGCMLPVQGVRAHKAILKQDLAVGDRVNTVVDGVRRDAIKRNHTGTHLLHAALRQVLGTHVKQAGSPVDPDRLRFDFSHFAQVADEELRGD